MKPETKRRTVGVINALPDVLAPQAEGNYYALISHSAADLSERAWKRTGTQMVKALKVFEKRNPDTKKKLYDWLELTEDRQGFEDALREFERQRREIDERYRSFNVNDEQRHGSERQCLDTIES